MGSKNDPVFWGRQGRGVSNTPPNRARQGPGGYREIAVDRTGNLHSSPWRGRQEDERKTYIRHRRWRLEGVFDTPLQLGTSMDLKNTIPCPL